MHLLGKKTCRWKIVKDAVGKREREREKKQWNRCSVQNHSVQGNWKKCQETKSESLLDDGKKTKTKWIGTDEVLYLDIHHQETI